MTAVRNIEYPGNSGSPACVAGVTGSGSTQPLVGRTLEFACATTDGAFYAADNLLTTSIIYTTGTSAGDDSLPAKSPEQTAFEQRKLRLINAVRRMKVSAPNWSGYDSAVRETSAESAEKFLNCLPGNSVLPKVAPDGEGDVMFVWDDPAKSCIVIVEPRMLHLVSRPGTSDVKQVRSQQFLGVSLPPTIQQYIPSK
jgi:hypothetical protein